ncbi:MAG: hypothetical protein KDD36_03565 [Flavobacteriales bacterium]|nr:hypothetical protein [Flavobacteriales bacterium]
MNMLNAALIWVSLLMAYVIPFHLFLYAFAILGPLHYVTELNWLEQKQFFVKGNTWKWAFGALAFGFSLPYMLQIPLWNDVVVAMGWPVQQMYGWINGCVWMALILAATLVFLKDAIARILVLLAGISSAFLLRDVFAYNLWIGLFLPTIIHVYLFTYIFMIYGHLKEPTSTGIACLVSMLLVPLFIVALPVFPEMTPLSEYVKATFTGNDFHVLNVMLGRSIGSSDGKGFYFYAPNDYKMQVFVAFAYIYHYLNWFSKTTVIGWHKNLTTKRTIAIILLWVVSAGLFMYDYRTGMLCVLLLTTLHVFFEFPLNLISIKEVVRLTLIKPKPKAG